MGQRSHYIFLVTFPHLLSDPDVQLAQSSPRVDAVERLEQRCQETTDFSP